MDGSEVRKLAEALEEARKVDDALAARVAGVVNQLLPVATIDVGDVGNTDAVLLVVDRVLPGWSITIDGVASAKDGHWVCVLRSSGMRDNDPFVGIGKCPALSQAVLVAMLKALSFTLAD